MKMKKVRIDRLIIKLGLVGILACGLLLSATGCSTKAMASSQPASTPDIKKVVEAYGTVKAVDVQNILIDFQARVEKVHVREGEKVAAGQPLVTLDLTEYQAQADNKKLQLEAARKDLHRSSEGADVKKLQNDLKNAESIYNKDLKELSSKEALYTAGSISLTELENYRRTVAAEKKNIEDIQYAIEGLKTGKTTEKDRKSIEASLLESELTLMNSRLEKPYMKGSDIVSTLSDGLVYELGYTPGDVTGPQKKVLSLMNLDSLVVEANVPEEFIKDVKEGAEVTITPAADKSREYKGKVTFISGKAFTVNGETLVAVRISIENRDTFLLPDFNVEVAIEI